MTDLRIRITEHRLAERYGEWETVYAGNTGEAATILRDTLRAAQVYDIPTVLDALYACPDLCRLAAAVANIQTIETLGDDEALPVLIQMRGSEKPEWLRTLACRELSRRGYLLLGDIAEGDRAACDASEVVG
jgi:hypothetical protein